MIYYGIFQVSARYLPALVSSDITRLTIKNRADLNAFLKKLQLPKNKPQRWVYEGGESRPGICEIGKNNIEVYEIKLYI